MSDRVGTWRMSCQLDDDEGPPVGCERPGGFAATCRTEQVRASIGRRRRANVPQWGKSGEAKTIAQLVRRCWRLPAGSIPAAARSAANDDSSPAPGRLSPDKGGPLKQVSANQHDADYGCAAQRASPLARDGRPRNDRRAQPETYVEHDPGARIRPRRRAVRMVTISDLIGVSR